MKKVLFAIKNFNFTNPIMHFVRMENLLLKRGMSANGIRIILPEAKIGELTGSLQNILHQVC